MHPLREHRLRGWLLAAGVTLLAAALRLPGLGTPRTLVFDETYYVKDAWTLLNLGYEAQWPAEPNPAFEAGDVHSYLTAGSYVVHPQVGKWLIAAGLRVLGAQDPVGWRISSAVAGILAVLVLTRVARRLFRSDLLGTVAGVLMAIDGMAIVHSRTALLDGFLMLFVLLAFGALLIDRDHARAQLAAATGPPRSPSRWGPGLGVRGWRLAAGVLLGLALGTKWSAVWFIAVFGLLTVGWDATARRRARVRRWWQAALLRDAPAAFLSLVPVAALVYVASWFSWFRSEKAYARSWATNHPGEGVTWLPDALRSWWHYHQEMWGFHTTLSSEHSYAADAWGWLWQWRPTSFFYESPEPALQACGADRCAQAVTSIGNPLVWWFGTLAVALCLWWVLRRRDELALVALTGVVAGWLPWFAFPDRTIFTFYAIVLLPWLILCVVRVVARVLERRTPVRVGVLVGLAVLVVAVSAFYWPIWTAQVIPFRLWQLHMWLPSWV